MAYRKGFSIIKDRYFQPFVIDDLVPNKDQKSYSFN